MAAIVEDGKLRLSGYVGDYYYSDGFTSDDVVMALAEIDDAADLDVHINSPGGIATEGSAIHALLVARKGVTNIVIEGIAASAASLIAMAGAARTMSAGAVLMIHDPSAITMGTSADHAKSIEGLEALATSYARVYADASGKTADECRVVMKDETWFTPEQAVAAGFATGTTEKPQAVAVAAFDYRLYAHAPSELRAMAQSKNWSLRAPDNPAVSAAHPSQTPEKSMPTEKERADQLAADNTKLTADIAALTAGQTAAVTAAATSAAAIVDLCAKAGVPTMASVLIVEGLTVEQAKARVDNTSNIRSAVELARKSCPTMAADLADTFIAAGLTMDQVRAKLFETMTAAQSPEIRSAHQAGPGGDEAAMAAAGIVAAYRGLTGTQKRSA
jgi:ATP-dependent protease ClpP protease subunit